MICTDWQTTEGLGDVSFPHETLMSCLEEHVDDGRKRVKRILRGTVLHIRTSVDSAFREVVYCSSAPPLRSKLI
eukprot:2099833-Amphidinium_carterae.1